MHLGLIPCEAGFAGVKAVWQSGFALVPQGRRVRDGGSGGVNEILSQTIDDLESAISVPKCRTGHAGKVSKDALPRGSRDKRATDYPRVLAHGTKVQP